MLEQVRCEMTLAEEVDLKYFGLKTNIRGQARGVTQSIEGFRNGCPCGFGGAGIIDVLVEVDDYVVLWLPDINGHDTITARFERVCDVGADPARRAHYSVYLGQCVDSSVTPLTQRKFGTIRRPGKSVGGFGET